MNTSRNDYDGRNGLRTWLACNEALQMYNQNALVLSIGFQSPEGNRVIHDMSLSLVECKTESVILQIKQRDQRWPINQIRDELLPLLRQNRPIIHGQTGAPKYLVGMLRDGNIGPSLMPATIVKMLCHDIRPLWDRCEGIAPYMGDSEKYKNPPPLAPFDYATDDTALDRLSHLKLIAAMRRTKEIATPRVYISGPITNNKDYVQEFAAAEDLLAHLGYLPVNPVKLVQHLDSTALPPAEFWARAMEIDLKEMCQCDEIMLLPLKGLKSQGVAIETAVAKNYGINVQPAHFYREKVQDRFGKLGFEILPTQERNASQTRGRR